MIDTNFKPAVQRASAAKHRVITYQKLSPHHSGCTNIFHWRPIQVREDSGQMDYESTHGHKTNVLHPSLA